MKCLEIQKKTQKEAQKKTKEEIQKKTQKIYRVTYYFVGLFILALGITLNTKTGLGVSPIISVPYSISQIYHFNFGNTTLVIYCLFVVIQFFLKGKKAKLADLLQVPLAIVFTRIMNLFLGMYQFEINNMLANFALLIVAVVLTGIGAAMSVNMRLVPNPGDGIVQAIADKVNQKMGFVKNCFDLFNIILTTLICLATGNAITGIGVGTIVAVIGVGRAIALFNYLMKEKMDVKTGIV